MIQLRRNVNLICITSSSPLTKANNSNCAGRLPTLAAQLGQCLVINFHSSHLLQISMCCEHSQLGKFCCNKFGNQLPLLQVSMSKNFTSQQSHTFDSNHVLTSVILLLERPIMEYACPAVCMCTPKRRIEMGEPD